MREPKRRLLAIERMLLPGDPLTLKDITRKLDLHYDIQADRKSIYDDIKALNYFMPIELFWMGNTVYYQHVPFEE